MYSRDIYKREKKILIRRKKKKKKKKRGGNEREKTKVRLKGKWGDKREFDILYLILLSY